MVMDFVLVMSKRFYRQYKNVVKESYLKRAKMQDIISRLVKEGDDTEINDNEMAEEERNYRKT